MNDPELVAVDQSVKDGCDNIASLRLGEPLFLHDLIEKLNTKTFHQKLDLKEIFEVDSACRETYLAALHEFHDQEEVFMVLVDVVKLDNVGMVHLLKNVDLVLQTHTVFFGKFSPMDIFRSNVN